MTIPQRVLQLVLGAGVFLVAFGVLRPLVGVADFQARTNHSAVVSLALLTVFGLPALAAASAAKRFARRYQSSTAAYGSWPRAVRRIVLFGYGLTAAFGVPAVLSEQGDRAVQAYKALVPRSGVQEAYPRIRTYGAIPLFPGLILSYHEYVWAGDAGWQGFELSLWYGVGVKFVGELPTWVA